MTIVNVLRSGFSIAKLIRKCEDSMIMPWTTIHGTGKSHGLKVNSGLHNSGSGGNHVRLFSPPSVSSVISHVISIRNMGNAEYS